MPEVGRRQYRAIKARTSPFDRLTAPFPVQRTEENAGAVGRAGQRQIIGFKGLLCPWSIRGVTKLYVKSERHVSNGFHVLLAGGASASPR